MSTRISVMIAVPDAGGAAAWYERALGAVQLWSLGHIWHFGDATPLARHAAE